MSNYCKNCYELTEQLDQLKEQLEAYKMEAEEGKEINSELKAENENLNNTLDNLLENNLGLRHALTEIKEIVGIGLVDGLQPEEYSGFLKILQAQILQKISECEVE